jgi:polyribonucleotide nucleotidyltransferase
VTIDGDSLLKIINFMLPIAVGIYTWIVTQNNDAHHEIKALDEKLTAATGRVSKLEGEITHLPDKDMVHRIELGMKDMQSRIEAQAEVVKAVERTMQRVETFLLEAQNRPQSTARRSK